MANYSDERFSDPSSATLGDRIKTLLTVCESVEIVKGPNDELILRLWHAAPYDLSEHNNIGRTRDPGPSRQR